MTLRDSISEHLSAMFQCSDMDGRVRIRTPFSYPDGDVVDLYVKQQNDGGVVSDLGESSAWLRMQSSSLRRSPKQSALIEDVCRTLGIEFYKGCLVRRFNSDLELANAVQAVSQAAVRVGDIWFTFRTRAIESINDEVSDLLTEHSIDFVRGDKIVGRSGRMWTVDFHTRTKDISSLVFVASTGNRSAARRISEHVLAAWVDLNRVTTGPEGLRPITLVDDEIDVWAEEDLALMEQGSKLARWSAHDEFIDLLSSAA